MHLSKRLRRVAENVTKVGTAADIGCDHAFTAIYLVQSGRAERAIAMDVGKEPLCRAKEHILQYQLEEKIDIRLSDGVKALKEGEAEAIVISGLGGQLMCRILEEGLGVVRSAKELILSPQSDIFPVRKKLHALGFCIVHEEMVFDRGKYYVILRAVPGVEKYEYPEEYIFGKCLIEKRDAVFYEYLKKQSRQLEAVIENMEKSSLSEDGKEQLEEQKERQSQMIQVLHKIEGME
mgnify:CR=1 FL=1